MTTSAICDVIVVRDSRSKDFKLVFPTNVICILTATHCHFFIFMTCERVHIANIKSLNSDS